VISRQYFAQQAAALLKFAKETKNPELAAVLIEKAADFGSEMEKAPDRDTLAPDVNPKSKGGAA